MIQGIHYRNRLFYRLQTSLKLGPARNHRFQLAASHINGNSHILDVCSGPGDLRNHLPTNCQYTALDASPAFLKYLNRQGIRTLNHNIHNPLPQPKCHFDVAVMLISLCHLPTPRAQTLLEELKLIAHKVIIVEEIVQQKRPKKSRLQRTMNFLSETPYARGYELMTRLELEKLMHQSEYKIQHVDKRYMVGIYLPSEE